jgi:hypothetical protein
VIAVIAALVIGFIAKGGSEQPPKSGTAETSNEPRQLASQVLGLKDDIVLTDSTRTALEAYAKTGKVTNFCGASLSEVDPLLLQVLVKLQQDGYRVMVNNFGVGNDRERSLCFNQDGSPAHDQHVAGRAVDLNGIIKKGGPQTSWGNIAFRPGGEMQAIQAYADAWLDFLPRNRGGVGQEGCLNGVYPRPGGFHVRIPAGSTNAGPASFTDSCEHLHIDVRVR